MTWLVDLFGATSVSSSVLILALVAALGLILGTAQVKGVRLGIAGVLFAGLLFGHLGATLAPPVLEFARDLGLILFVYAVGIEVGPGFLPSLRRYGLWLNLTAAAVVAAAAVLAALANRLLGVEMPVAAGLFSGATTNTPSLGAAQATLHQLPGYGDAASDLPGLGYAVTYPFGVVGIIFSMIAVRGLFPKAAGKRRSPAARPAPTGLPPSARLSVLPVFLGIALGVLLGSLPVAVRGLPIPLRLGLAGGPLVVAIALGAVGRLGPLDWRLPPAAADLMREFGIVLFLACVGVRSGGGFVRTVAHGEGLFWMALGAGITLAPLLIAIVATRLLIRTSYASACGLLAGSMTNPASLAFAISTTHSEETTLAYATVYPLTMVLRVIAAQLIVLLLAR